MISKQLKTRGFVYEVNIVVYCDIDWHLVSNSFKYCMNNSAILMSSAVESSYNSVDVLIRAQFSEIPIHLHSMITHPL